MRGGGNTETNDAAFWRKIFGVFAPEISVKISSIGRKSILVELAEKVRLGTILNVFIAMDRDFDNHLSKKMPSVGIFYTKGYSFENDIWHASTILKVAKDICVHIEDDCQLFIPIKEAYRNFYKDARRAIRVDIALANNSQPLLFNVKPNKFICRKSEFPRFNKSAFRTRLNELRGRSKYFCPKEIELHNHDDCHGCLSAAFGYNILISVLRKNGSKLKLPKIEATRLIISAFSNCLQTGLCEEYQEYFSTQFVELKY